MNYEYLFNLANELIESIFSEMKDKSGIAYVMHPKRVASSLEKMDEKIVALLHDAIEDTYITEEVLLEMGFPGFIVEAVSILTIRKNEEYDNYIKRIIASNNKLVLSVKKADMEDNMKEERLIKLDESEKQRLLNKYTNNYKLICEAFENN